MRANLPSATVAGISRPNCAKKRGFVYAVWASSTASRYLPKRGKRAAIATAFCQSFAAAAFLRVCSLVSIFVTLPMTGYVVQSKSRI